MDLDLWKESVITQLNLMIEQVKNDPQYFKKIAEEPLYYGNQMWIGRGMDFLRLNLKISKEKIKV
jgi:hypothetical protein